MTRLFVEQLTVIDCAYLDAARGLVGESWIVDLELEGELDDQSMVLDFGQVKRRVKQLIDDSVDHTLLVPAQSPALSLRRSDGRMELSFQTAAGDIEHASPACAVTVLNAGAVGPEALRAHLMPLLRPALPANVRELGLALRHERIDGAYYHYTHGLKKHRGECQRIAHGHRSKLEIRANGQRQPDTEASVSRDWVDIYLATREDLVAHAGGRMRFAYDAPEGHFELTLPESRVRLLDHDTTVECIAEHLAARLAGAPNAGGELEIRAYEGVNKGAIARR